MTAPSCAPAGQFFAASGSVLYLPGTNRSLAIEPEEAGRRFARQHVVTEDELQAVRQVDAIALSLRIAAREAAFRVGFRAALIIDAHEVWADNVACSIQHRRHPVGRTVKRRHARRLAARAERVVRRRRVCARVSVELVKVALAGLAGIDDRIVAKHLAGITDKAERSDDVRAG